MNLECSLPKALSGGYGTNISRNINGYNSRGIYPRSTGFYPSVAEAPAPAEFDRGNGTEARGEGHVGGRGLTVRQPREVFTAEIFLVPHEISKGARI